MLLVSIMLAALISILILTVKAYLDGSAGLLPSGVRVLLQDTTALYEFVIFIIKTGAALLFACSLSRVSNHIILSLDIIFLFSILMPVMFHSIGQSRCFSLLKAL